MEGTSLQKVIKRQSSQELASCIGRTSRDAIDVLCEERGEKGTLDFRIHHIALSKVDEDKVISLWHDLPLFVTDDAGVYTGCLNFVCEIPKFSRKKYEIATNEDGNPIKQDTKKGVLREFKKGDIFFNYGCFPRTWEDPDFVHPDVGVGGDNDPLDVCEIGLGIIPTADIRQVKVLGVLCLIDDGEADWKVIVIDKNDRWAKDLNDVDDVERLLPGTIDSIREWFRTYKIPDGKPPNRFGLDERCMDKRYAMKVIAETHEAWKTLVMKPRKNLSIPKLSDLDLASDSTAVSQIEVEEYPESLMA